MRRSQTMPLALAGGIALLLLGSCAILLGVVFLFEANTPETEMTISTALFTIFLGLPFVVLGSSLMYFILKSYRHRRQEEIEAKILQAAIARDYRITAAEVAMLTDLSLADAHAYLEKQARSGLISVEVGENGMLIYHFSS